MKEFMTYEMALLESKIEGEQRGREEGRSEGIESVALNLISMGISFDKIQEATKLSIQRIKELAKQSL